MKKRAQKSLQKKKPLVAEGGGFKNYYLGVLFGTFALFVLLSIASYSPLDRCINVASNQPTKNICGAYGAVVADLMFQFFGISSWLFFLFPLSWSIIMFRNKKFEDFFFFGRRFASMIIATISLSGAVAFARSYNFAMKMILGGYIGYYISSVAEEKIGAVLSFIVFGMLFLTFGFLAIRTKNGSRSYLLQLLLRIFNKSFLKRLFHQALNIVTFRFLLKLFKHLSLIHI
jgi:hypothetical protein